jgi:hypothetical protein
MTHLVIVTNQGIYISPVLWVPALLLVVAVLAWHKYVVPEINYRRRLKRVRSH